MHSLAVISEALSRSPAWVDAVAVFWPPEKVFAALACLRRSDSSTKDIANAELLTRTGHSWDVVRRIRNRTDTTPAPRLPGCQQCNSLCRSPPVAFHHQPCADAMTVSITDPAGADQMGIIAHGGSFGAVRGPCLSGAILRRPVFDTG